MALETATYITSLVISNPDGGDQRSTADDHIRLIKAVLKRTFPNMDGPISLSSAQAMYLGDLSASVQLQLNQLRDGTATAANAINARYANSASLAVNATMLGGLSLSMVATLSYTNVYSTYSQWGGPGLGTVRVQPGSSTNPGYVEFLGPDGIRRGYLGWASNNTLLLAQEGTYAWQFFGVIPPTINGNQILHTASALNAGNLTNSLPNAVVTVQNINQHGANLLVGFASLASTAVSASSAATLGNFAGSVPNVASTVMIRDANGDAFSRLYNMAAGAQSFAPVELVATNGSDNFMRRVTVAQAGQSIEARNISGRTGTAKTLSSAAPSGGSNGDIWYRF